MSNSIALTEAIEKAKTYARRAHASETHRAYRNDWHAFQFWCRATGCNSLPADPLAVAAYLGSLATTHSRSALQRRLAAIGYQHKLNGLVWSASHPAIHATLRGIGRLHGTRKRKRPAAAPTSVELKRLLGVCKDDVAGMRDRALLLLCFAGALRRSELVNLDHDHVRPTAAGLRLLIGSSKTDAQGDGHRTGPSTPCPPAASAPVIPSSAFAIANAQATALGLGSRRARVRNSANDKFALINSATLFPLPNTRETKHMPHLWG